VRDNRIDAGSDAAGEPDDPFEMVRGSERIPGKNSPYDVFKHVFLAMGK